MSVSGKGCHMIPEKKKKKKKKTRVFKEGFTRVDKSDHHAVFEGFLDVSFLSITLTEYIVARFPPPMYRVVAHFDRLETWQM